jgi:hypothetical protein
MSEKKSWDIQRKPVARPEPPSAPARPEPVRASRPVARKAPRKERPVRAIKPPKPVKVRPQPRVRVVQGKKREPLRDQRIRARKRARVLFFIALALLIAGLYGALWLPALRIQHVDAAGPDASAAQSIAQTSLEGTYYYVFPRNSVFLFSQQQIRAEVLAQYPEISALSISRTSLSSISIRDIPRETAFIWCGETFGSPPSVSISPAIGTTTLSSASSTDSTYPSQTTVPAEVSPCYNADSEGFVFSEAPNDTSSSLKIYSPLAKSADPIGNTVMDASDIPNALQFVKAIESINVPITSFVIRADAQEIDLYAAGGTRITYVLGREQKAIVLAEASFPSLMLTNGSLDYVDLRFDGKVFFMKKGSAAPQQTVTVSTSTPAH